LNPSEVTRLLQADELNQPELIDRLVPLLYEELRTVAHRHLRGERSDHTLNTTALVHEAYLRVADLEEMSWNDRVHFLATAARMMRRILIDYARKRNAEKRGGGIESEPLEEDGQLPEGRGDGLELADLISLDQALERLSELDRRQASVLELRYFGGLELQEIATAVDVSLATVKRDLAAARAWLAQRLRDRTNA
jgi:RNA polymerase sigma factor (TIGR02999 family)